jgi:rhodanese-related sulfurtransferase
MRKKNFLVLSLTIALILTAGCSKKEDNSTYTKISAEEAKKMMDEKEDIIILDVRTEEEYQEGHIDGAILIPDNEITETAESILTDKSATILVYCRSGRRSANASKELSELEYTNIYDFGGINNWKYDIVTE